MHREFSRLHIMRVIFNLFFYNLLYISTSWFVSFLKLTCRLYSPALIYSVHYFSNYSV